LAGVRLLRIVLPNVENESGKGSDNDNNQRKSAPSLHAADIQGKGKKKGIVIAILGIGDWATAT
jgi:hypothetical protein